MRHAIHLAVAIPALAFALAVTPARDAAACGGCFHAPAENTQVASHRMILSVSKTQSTLYDQIKYAGSPSSFAWVLPVKGSVTIGLSSDALFEELDQLTAVTVNAPYLGPCPQCFGSSSSSSGGGSSSSSSSGGVVVVAQMVVGPYETVQLSSSNPTALNTWLTTHGYAVPADVAPIISAYVVEGFDFLALKLVPGMGVDSMKPVRVTTPGGSPVLPLRMVAAGVGATIPITLFVAGEGRYEATNFPTFEIDPSKLVWDFGTESSNYKALRDQGFAATSQKGWLVESVGPRSEQDISFPLTNLAMSDPMNSGYADAMGNGAPQAAMDDMAALFGGINAGSLWVTRLLAELPRAALSVDLVLGAAANQVSVSNYLTAPTYVNAPICAPCNSSSSGSSGAGGSSGSSGVGGAPAGAGAGGEIVGTSGCAIGAPDDLPLAFGAAVTALAVLASRRRRTADRKRFAR